MAGTYDKPEMSPFFTALLSTFPAATITWRIKGPPGKKGIVRDMLIDVTTTLVGTTTVPEIGIGSAAGAAGALFNEYARFRLGTTAILGYTTTNGNALRARGLVTGSGGAGLTLSDFAGHVALETTTIPADTTVFISGIVGVGTPAGAVSTYIFIDWF